MAKAVAGIGDNLLSSVFVAWEYQKKRMIFCPACNVDMWNNAPTQRNVAYLKEMVCCCVMIDDSIFCYSFTYIANKHIRTLYV